MRWLVAIMLLVLQLAAPVRAEAPRAAAFVEAFGAACIPERSSFQRAVAHATELGWQPVVAGENAAYDRFIAHAEGLFDEEIAEDRDFYDAADGAWLTRVIDGRSYLLAIAVLLTDTLDTLSCHLYDFAATELIDPAPVSALLDVPVAYRTDGDDPFFAFDPDHLISVTWGPPPSLPGTGDTKLTFIPKNSPLLEVVGFTGLTLKFWTSLPNRTDLAK